MQQKLVVVNWKNLCDEQLAAKKLDHAAMNEDEWLVFAARVLDEVLEQQNKAGFKVTIASSDAHLNEELVLLCTESPITAPQHAKVTRLWQNGELDGLTPKDRSGTATLRLKGTLAEMNAAGLAVDAVILIGTVGILAITTEV